MAVDNSHAALRSRSATRLAVRHRRSFKVTRSSFSSCSSRVISSSSSSSNGGGGLGGRAAAGSLRPPETAEVRHQQQQQQQQPGLVLGLLGEKYLPDEIWTKIFGFLPGFQSRCLARCVCRSWNAILSAPGLPGAQIWGKHSPVFFLDKTSSTSCSSSGSGSDGVALESVGYNLRSGAWERLAPFHRPDRGRVALVSAAGGIMCLGTSLEDLAVTFWNPLTGWTADVPRVHNFGMYYCRIYCHRGSGLVQQHQLQQQQQPAAEFTVLAAGLKFPRGGRGGRDYASTATCVRVFRSGWTAWGPEHRLPDACNVLVGSVSSARHPGLIFCLVEKSINLRAGMHLLARQRLAVLDVHLGGWTRSEEIVAAKADIDGKECVIVPNCISQWEGRMFGTAQLRQDTTEYHFILELMPVTSDTTSKGESPDTPSPSTSTSTSATWTWKILAYNPYTFSDMSRKSAIATHDGRIVFTQSSQCTAECAVDCSGLRTVYDIRSGAWTELPHSSITRCSSSWQPEPERSRKLNMETLRPCNGVFAPNLADGPVSFPGLASHPVAAK